ncbi:MAG: HD domain-containing phosphohydrolase, partial [Sulfuricellaceae bacterium]
LAGETIPFNARLFALVDVFDALTSVRPYKQALPLAEVIREIEKGIGRHFDPDISYAFLWQAEVLYAEIGCAAPDKLRGRLSEVVNDYFGKMETA